MLIFSFNLFKAQTNLVPNPSFENHKACFYAMAVVSDVIDWYPAKESPDYFNVCANSFGFYPIESTVPYNCLGYMQPNKGDGYVGIGLYYNISSDSIKIASECIGIKLIQSLKANRCYYGEFYISLADFSDTQINSLGMLFTKDTFKLAYLNYNNTIQPQIQWDTTQFITDTLNWVKVSGTFVAQGGEEYVTIGNFKDGAHVKKHFFTNTFGNPCSFGNPDAICYVYIDDVALYELPQTPTGSSNYTVCLQSDSLVLGDTARVATTDQWFANGVPISNQSQIKIKPNTTTTYVLQTMACSSSTQTFAVTYNNICPPVITELIIPNTFTPNDDDINDVFKFEVNGVTGDVSFEVYNRWGNLVASRTSATIEPNIYSQVTILWDGRTTSGEPCSEGVYFYTLKYTDANGEQQAKNGYVSLFR
jgi:gliding motility-associated-like protein